MYKKKTKKHTNTHTHKKEIVDWWDIKYIGLEDLKTEKGGKKRGGGEEKSLPPHKGSVGYMTHAKYNLYA